MIIVNRLRERGGEEKYKHIHIIKYVTCANQEVTRNWFPRNLNPSETKCILITSTFRLAPN